MNLWAIPFLTVLVVVFVAGSVAAIRDRRNR